VCINFFKFLSLRLVRGASLVASQRERGRTVAVRQAEHAAAEALVLERLLRALGDRQRAAIQHVHLLISLRINIHTQSRRGGFISFSAKNPTQDHFPIK
jgi:hypothetical protein